MGIPVATYRLQFHRGFGFTEAQTLIPYLRALGITDIYASPIFKARPGSSHGYDVVDPNALNPELGTAEDFEALISEVRQHGMGWLQDIVPNHMAYDSGNTMLMDVLENGPNSRFADFFDIEWDHPVESMRGKVLAPCLGRYYGQCLEDGELVFRYDAGGLAIHYYQQRFPINIESYSQVLDPGVGRLRAKLGRQHPDLIKLLGVLYTLKNLPLAEESRERADQIVFIKSMLWELYGANEEIKHFIDESVAQFNGRKGEPESFNALDRLLGQQYYRLSFWKVATEEINYRRFFNINELISLRTEEPKVFDATHVLVLRLVREGKITGLRVDHIDGLYDPATYLRRIRDKTGDIYLVVEKVLDLEERLPDDWGVRGTTGYDFTNYVNGLFCQGKNERRLSTLYARFTGLQTPLEQLVSEKKRMLIGKHMAGDVDRVAHLLKRISSHDRFGSDITLYGLKRALVEVLTFFPVYRSYISPDVYTDDDRRRIRGVMDKAKEMNPALLLELSFIEKFLLLDYGEHSTEEEKNQWIHFVMRLQQLTGPLMAKGFEDTTLYIYNRLLSLNEVGGNPGRFGISAQAFHEFNQARGRRWPHSLNATSTHDTKRGEDARARINVLSEIPEEWEAHVFQWSRLNRPHKSRVKEREVPTRNDEYFLYQSLIGALPFGGNHDASFTGRVKAYIIKAVREAKVHTEWLKPDNVYEEAFLSFIDKLLEPSESNPFLREFLPFARRVCHFGALNTLSQTLLKITSPGIPDFYQGTELWDLNFVDPDNRRPVDFRQRMKLLEEIKTQEQRDLPSLLRDTLSDWASAKAKLYVTYKALECRRRQKDLFHGGEYLPVYASGKTKDHVCAFAKKTETQWALVAVPRFPAQWIDPGKLPLGDLWGEAALSLPRTAPSRWLHWLTKEQVSGTQSGNKTFLPLQSIFRSFPVALLIREQTSAWS